MAHALPEIFCRRRCQLNPYPWDQITHCEINRRKNGRGQECCQDSPFDGKFSFLAFLQKNAPAPWFGTRATYCFVVPPKFRALRPLLAPFRRGDRRLHPQRGLIRTLGGRPSRAVVRTGLSAKAPLSFRYACGTASASSRLDFSNDVRAADGPSHASPNRRAGGRESASPPWPGWWRRARCASRTAAGSASPAGLPRGRCWWDRRR